MLSANPVAGFSKEKLALRVERHPNFRCCPVTAVVP